MSDGAKSRKRHKKKRHFGARLFPTQIDDLATDELFTGISDGIDRRSSDFVIDLRALERKPNPLVGGAELPQRRPVANR